MRVVFMGTPDFAVSALRRLCESHDVVGVYTQPPRPAGRGQQARPSPVQIFAAQRGIDVLSPASLRTPEAEQQFAAFRADVAVVAAYGIILPKAILAIPSFGCLNIHASLLPRWRGAAPIQRAIMAGDDKSGVTIMQMEAGLDTGPMLLHRETPITDTTTAGALHDTLADLGADLIVGALAQIKSLTPTPQPSVGVTHAAKIEKSEAKIDFTRPAHNVLRHINALSPTPGAWFEHGVERIKILGAVVDSANGSPGTVLDDRLTIACKNNAIRPLMLQRGGKAATDVDAFLRGYALPAGTQLA